MKPDSRQLTLDLGYRPALGRQDFVVAPCNAEAVAWLDRWPQWPSPGLVLTGPPGSGKTHLLASFVAAHHGVMLKAAQVSVVDLPDQVGDTRLLLVDDLSVKSDQAALFHLYNWAVQHDIGMVFAADRPISHLALTLADLDSRLKSLPSVEIGSPDDHLLTMVMAKQFADRQVAVAPDVLHYLVGRMERSFDEARRVVETLDKASLSQGRAVTIPLIKQTLF